MEIHAAEVDILGSICLFIFFNNNVASLAPRPSLKHVNTPSTLSDQSLHFSLPVGAFNSFFFLDRYVEHILLTQLESVAFRAFHKAARCVNLTFIYFVM